MISYYDVTVPVFIKTLTNLKSILQKGALHAKEQGISEADYLQRQLAPDMFPLVRQIQIATDSAKGVTARLTETTPLVIEDTETTCAELEERIEKVLTYLRTFTLEQFANAAEAKVTLPYFPGKYLEAPDYLVEHALPNFFFHVSIAYAIIRASGAEIGKADYIGGLTLHDVV